MTDKEKIEEMGVDICKGCNSRLDPTFECNRNVCTMAEIVSEYLIDIGWTKQVWHKVADGDLPSKTGEYLTISRSGHYCVLKYCAEDFLGPYDEDYDFEKDNNMMNLKKGFNDFDSESCEFFVTNLAIAWTEIPKYE